jgi:hypothetical protein
MRRGANASNETCMGQTPPNIRMRPASPAVTAIPGAAARLAEKRSLLGKIEAYFIGKAVAAPRGYTAPVF